MSKQNIEIPLCGTVPLCLKCLAPSDQEVTHTYHDRQTCQEATSPPCRTLGSFGLAPEVLEEVLGDHVCRVCTRCGFGWVERPARPGSPYEVRESE